MIEPPHLELIIIFTLTRVFSLCVFLSQYDKSVRRRSVCITFFQDDVHKECSAAYTTFRAPFVNLWCILLRVLAVLPAHLSALRRYTCRRMLGTEFAVSKVTLDLFVRQIYRVPAAFVVVAHSSPVTHND